jgi:hypothetical protein
MKEMTTTIATVREMLAVADCFLCGKPMHETDDITLKRNPKAHRKQPVHAQCVTAEKAAVWNEQQQYPDHIVEAVTSPRMQAAVTRSETLKSTKQTNRRLRVLGTLNSLRSLFAKSSPEENIEMFPEVVRTFEEILHSISTDHELIKARATNLAPAKNMLRKLDNGASAEAAHESYVRTFEKEFLARDVRDKMRRMHLEPQ